jgi:hypothetical protein
MWRTLEYTEAFRRRPRQQKTRLAQRLGGLAEGIFPSTWALVVAQEVAGVVCGEVCMRCAAVWLPLPDEHVTVSFNLGAPPPTACPLSQHPGRRLGRPTSMQELANRVMGPLACAQQALVEKAQKVCVAAAEKLTQRELGLLIVGAATGAVAVGVMHYLRRPGELNGCRWCSGAGMNQGNREKASCRRMS